MSTPAAEVSCRVVVDITTPVDLAFRVAVARDRVSERLEVTHAGVPATDVCELVDAAGTRTHVLSRGPGRLELSYAARVGQGRDPAPATTGDLLEATRPSRYAESDRLVGVAATEFGDLRGPALALAVRDWVHRRLVYVTGSSRPTDGAVETLLTGAGVCRDYAHLVAALLRALDVPARVASVYAPGLSPMDFHAVAEAYIDGGWQVVDATARAPRSSLVRIATGQDASETAFLSQHGAAVDLRWMAVTAVVDDLPGDDLTRLVQLR